MEQTFWTYFFVVLTFGLYIGIAIWSRAGSTEEFYVAGHDVHPTVNGMATYGLDGWLCVIGTLIGALPKGIW